MTSPEDRIADALLAAWRSGGLVDHRDLPPPADAEAAYRIQARVAEATGPAGGYKTGRATPDAPLIFAPVPARLMRAEGAVIPSGESRLRGVELEVAYRIEDSLPSADASDFAARLAATVTAIAALEIVESRLADPEAAGPLWKLADNQINYGIVSGSAGAVPADLSATLQIGPELAVDGPVVNTGGAPFDVFADFVALAERRGIALKPGFVVITGSVTGLRYAAAGHRVVGRIAGLGEVSCSFEPAGPA